MTEDPGARGRLAPKLVTSYMSLFAQVVFVIGLTAYIVERLGREALGGWGIVLAAMNIIRLLDLGMSQTTARYVAVHRDAAELNRVTATSLAFLGAVGLAGALVTIPIALQAEAVFGDEAAGLPTALAVACAGSCLVLPLYVFSNVLYGLGRITARNVILTGRPLLAGVAAVVAVEAGGGLAELVIAVVAAELAVALAQIAYAYATIDGLAPRLSDVHRSTLREMAGFGVAVLAMSFAAQITYYSGNLVVGAVLGAAAVAVFSVAARLVEGMSMLLNQFGDVFLPRLAHLSSRDRVDEARGVMLAGTTAILLAGYPAIAVLVGLGQPLVDLWVGDGFEDAWRLLALLCAGLAVTAPIRFGVLWAIGAARHRAIAVIALAEAVVSIGLSIGLTHAIGVEGVAISVFASLAISNGILIPPIVYRQIGMSVWRDYYRRVLIAAAVAVPVAAALHLGAGPWLESRPAALLLAAPVCFALAFLATALAMGELLRVRELVRGPADPVASV